ncbi:MAG TPA: sugar ABC transporter permease [Gemmatimonadales bacterium]|nr:sugar ABC transporter permease [Gemmatimonadales bacterium]
MSAPGVRRWRAGALAAVGVSALLCFGITRWVRDRYERALAARSAASTAAYLALVTPAARSGVGYDLPQLLIRSRALEHLPGFHARVEIYHRTAPLVNATAPPLAPQMLDSLRRQPGVRCVGRAAVVPLFDRQGWDVVGAVAAQATMPEGLVAVALAAALALALAAGTLAVRAVGESGGRGGHAALPLALRRYGAAAGLFGLVACASVRAAARGATDLWLSDARLLMQEAAALLPDARIGPANLASIARDAEVVPGDSAGAAARRHKVAGLPRATVAVRLRPGRWASLRTFPEEAGAAGWLAATLGLALLGPLGVAGAAWGARAAARPRHFRETVAAWGFLAPSALHLAAFSFAPLAFTLYLSTHRWSLIEPVQPFVGLTNYARLLRDPLVWTSLSNTTLYVLYVPVSTALALLVALGLNHRSWGARALRTVFFLPHVASGVAIALVWQWLYRPEAGVINALLSRVHVGPVDWLGDPRAALVAVMIVSLWAQLGYQMTVFVAALQGIPRAYLDAARVDGASAWQRFRRVTFPLLRPVTLFVLVGATISAFQVFTYVYVLTGGGPLHATDVLVYRIYQTGWEFWQLGSASALALLLSTVLCGITWVQFRLLVKRVQHG